MRDRTLERRMVEMRELIDLWGRFHEMMVAVVKGAGFTDEHDREFLNVKSAIARKFQAISDKFEKRMFPEEEVTEVLSQAVSLEQVKKMSSFTTGQFENTWHRVHIAFNRVLGHLESERDALARVSTFGFGIKKLARSKLLIFLVILAIMFGGIFMGYRFYTQKVKPAFEVSEKGEETEAQAELETLLGKIGELVDVVKMKIEGAEPGEGAEARRVSLPASANWGSLIWGIVGAVLCGWLASTKGRNPILWGAFGLLCCPIAFIILLLKS